jgi:hypothetical protein
VASGYFSYFKHDGSLGRERVGIRSSNVAITDTNPITQRGVKYSNAANAVIQSSQHEHLEAPIKSFRSINENNMFTAIIYNQSKGSR